MFETVLMWIDRMNVEFDINPARVLDIGSLDRNMKVGARAQFPNSEYIGADIDKGPNVDEIVDVYRLEQHFGTGRFDAILCLHLLEHIARPWDAVEQITKVLAPKGYMYLSMPTYGFPRHNYPGDYWRATHEAITEVFMADYDVLSIEDDKSKYSRHPFINCLGRKYA